MYTKCLFCNSPIDFNGTSKYVKKQCISNVCHNNEIMYNQSDEGRRFSFLYFYQDYLFNINYLWSSIMPTLHNVDIKAFFSKENMLGKRYRMYNSSLPINQVPFTPQNFEQKLPYLLNFI